MFALAVTVTFENCSVMLSPPENGGV